MRQPQAHLYQLLLLPPEAGNFSIDITHIFANVSLTLPHYLLGRGLLLEQPAASRRMGVRPARLQQAATSRQPRVEVSQTTEPCHRAQSTEPPAARMLTPAPLPVNSLVLVFWPYCFFLPTVPLPFCNFKNGFWYWYLALLFLSPNSSPPLLQLQKLLKNGSDASAAPSWLLQRCKLTDD